MRVLVGCFGNVLRGDDGFGVAVARALAERDLPPEVHVLDVGIGGISLVQELLDPADALVLVDAVDLGREPGTVLVLDPDVLDVATLPVTERRDLLADMHYATPERALMLARGLGVLPDTILMVGCQADDAERYGQGLSPAVAAAVDVAAAQVRHVVRDLGVAWA
jgi:hydrogenase maturation protease